MPTGALALNRLGVRSKLAGTSFLLAESLPSIDSADGAVPSLFADVAGTTDSSDFSRAFMSAVPSVTFADRSNGEVHRSSLPMETKEISRFSRLECPRMHRFVDSAVSVRTLPKRCARCCLLPVRTGSAHERGALFNHLGRELSSWPAFPFARTLKAIPLPESPLR